VGRHIRLALLVSSLMTILSSSVYAQASIAGVVKDSSGAVLPGVTVEAASPALIEKVRTVVTDGSGQYKIESLRSGAYIVTFTLPGFNTVKREGVELTGTFTATINAEMRVGALEETITVTGESPIVDVQNTKRQFVLGDELIRELPSSRNTTNLATLLPGVTKANQDVGGLNGESGSTAGAVTIHGVADVRTEVNGLSVHATQGSGTNGAGNMAAYQEMQIDTSGVSAEQKEGGVRINLIPRDGSNDFHGYYYGAFANHSMQGTNVTQQLTNRGLLAPNSLRRYVEANPYGGGRIVRDKLWFFATARYNNAVSYSSIYYNRNAGDLNAWTYEPDTSRGPATNENTWKSGNGRLTWQATPKNKIGVSYDYASSCPCPRNISATVSPEAGVTGYAPIKPGTMLFLDWTSTVTKRLLVEARFLKRDSLSTRPLTNIYFTHDPGPGVFLNAVTEQSTGLTYRASNTTATSSRNPVRQPRLTVSYITGAHDFKVGFNLGFQSQDQKAYSIDSPVSYRFNNGVPNQLTLLATPWRTFIDEQDHGLFVQDRWKLGRTTLTGGLRYDYFHVSFPAQPVGPSPVAPARSFDFPKTNGVTWHDLEPRVGIAHDLFGDGKTAVKVSLNKYLAFYGAPNAGGTDTVATFTSNMNPTARLVNTTTRSWTDANRNFVPECNLLNPDSNGECGAMANRDFGSTRPGSSYDPDTLIGWNRRPDSNWQFSAGVQRQLVPRVSVDVSYFRTWYTNLVVTDDRAINPGDFDTFSIAAPSDPNLPGGGGYTVSGLYNLKSSSFGRPSDNYITFADNYGKAINHWNGFDVTFNARALSGVTLQGGTSSGRTSTDNCEVAAKLPEILFGASNLGAENANVWLPGAYCHQVGHFVTQAKLIGTYQVPRIDVQVAATVQSLPGPQVWANLTATNAIVAPSLGRSLSGGAANMVVNITPPGRTYGERMNELDLRIGKILSYGRIRTTASIDLYNVFNANPVLTESRAYATWRRPQSILGARFLELVLKLDY
jgi:Carboxypeptidase regulatory-like domain